VSTLFCEPARFSTKAGEEDDGNSDGVTLNGSNKSDQNISGDGNFNSIASDGMFDKNGRPTLAYAKTMPVSFSSLKHEDILQLAAEKVPEATREMLIRNIMSVDNKEYDAAKETFDDIAEDHMKDLLFIYIPQKAGLVTAIVGACGSIPLVFHLPTVSWFNEKYVTADVPQPEDLETWLEVGSWSWAWMEPVLGQASFFLLAMAFARNQLLNMGIMPFTNLLHDKRAQRLVAKYPRYDSAALTSFSKSHITTPMYKK